MLTAKQKNELIQRKIRYFMLTKKISQRKLAEELGVSPPTISIALSGKHSLSLETIFKMEEVFGIRLLDYYIKGDVSSLCRPLFVLKCIPIRAQGGREEADTYPYNSIKPIKFS